MVDEAVVDGQVRVGDLVDEEAGEHVAQLRRGGALHGHPDEAVEVEVGAAHRGASMRLKRPAAVPAA